MKKLLTAFVALLSLSLSSLAAEGWLTEIQAGVDRAKKENKRVLVEFTGSDWCPPCKMMHKKVFSKKAFVEQASKDFVLVKIDIPNSDPALKAKNQKVLEQWKVRGVPTVILLDSEGKEYHRFTASQFPDVKPFIEHIRRASDLQGMQ